jgi:methionine synthase II (cobalamin-independent)
MTRLATTTIGSLYRFDPDLHRSIEAAVLFQREMGLDLVSDGEQRADMVSYFAESLAGLGVESGAPVVKGRVELAGDPNAFSKVEDLDYIRSRFPDMEVKVAITGPTTLGMTCGSRRIEAHYRGLLDFRLYEDLADALSPIARAVVDRGAHLQVDEPFLSQGFKDLGERVSLIDRVADGLPSERVSVHVCGHIGRFGLLDHLKTLENVSVLSFGFAGRTEGANVDVVSRAPFEDNGKRLGAGCISVTPLAADEVQSPSSVSLRLAKLAGLVGVDNIAYAHPDCGLRVTKRDLVPVILRNLTAGAAEVPD